MMERESEPRSLIPPFWHPPLWNFVQTPVKHYVYWSLETSQKGCSHTTNIVLKPTFASSPIFIENLTLPLFFLIFKDLIPAP